MTAAGLPDLFIASTTVGFELILVVESSHCITLFREELFLGNEIGGVLAVTTVDTPVFLFLLPTMTTCDFVLTVESGHGLSTILKLAFQGWYVKTFNTTSKTRKIHRENDTHRHFLILSYSRIATV